jgi:hypothetical protein
VSRRGPRTSLDWQHTVLPRAREIVLGYDTGVTLRQLFYRLVADGTLPNLQDKYRYLSRLTAEGRRDGTFPDLLDRTNRIERWPSFDGPRGAMDYLIEELYRRDRTEGQEWSVYLGVEKAGLTEQLDSWFGDPLGLPILALGGYISQTLADTVRRDIERDGRPAMLIYAGDFDPSGEDITRDFARRVGVFDDTARVALNSRQVVGLPYNPDPDVKKKLERDPRAKKFKERHQDFLAEHFGGEVVQIEVDALPPQTFRNLYQTAIDELWDADAHHAVMEQEEADLAELRRLAGQDE